MAAPVLVLLICLPLMRPLRHPDPTLISDDEQARLATIQAIVEQRTLQIQHTSFFATRDVIRVLGKNGSVGWYSDQSPLMSVLLSGPYWVMYRCGMSFEKNPILAEYLLTLFGVTLPIAFAAGLIYRMGRIFELTRPWRAGLAIAVVVGSGWISYATVLSAGAAAAALVVMGAACLVQASLTRGRVAGPVWVAVGGLCAALAATYELTAFAFLVFFVLAVWFLRWPPARRAWGLGLYLAGAAIPLVLYAGLVKPITGDLRPGFLHPELSIAQQDLDEDALAVPPAMRWIQYAREPRTLAERTVRGVNRIAAAVLGGHGLLTHFPILLFGLLGALVVLRRHWPRATQILAIVTICGTTSIVIGYALQPADWTDAMFANRWLLVFLPMTLFWAGAWLRRPHHSATWAAAATLFAFSATIALIGATDPQPRQGYQQYTALSALQRLIHPPVASSPVEMIAQSADGSQLKTEAP